MTKPSEPRLEPVQSVAIAAIGYDRALRSLFVRFREGGLYAYLDVPPEVFARFRGAASKGRFFQEEVGPAFRYLRLS